MADAPTLHLRPGKRLRIFLDENDRAGMRPRYAAIVELLRRSGVAGASVFRGIEGYGSHGDVHASGLLTRSTALPIVIEAIDEEARIADLLPELQRLVGEGLISLDAVEYLRIASS